MVLKVRYVCGMKGLNLPLDGSLFSRLNLRVLYKPIPRKIPVFRESLHNFSNNALEHLK
jgi:hypothetical protein